MGRACIRDCRISGFLQVYPQAHRLVKNQRYFQKRTVLALHQLKTHIPLRPSAGPHRAAKTGQWERSRNGVVKPQVQNDEVRCNRGASPDGPGRQPRFQQLPCALTLDPCACRKPKMSRLFKNKMFAFHRGPGPRERAVQQGRRLNPHCAAPCSCRILGLRHNKYVYSRKMRLTRSSSDGLLCISGLKTNIHIHLGKKGGNSIGNLTLTSLSCGFQGAAFLVCLLPTLGTCVKSLPSTSM